MCNNVSNQLDYSTGCSLLLYCSYLEQTLALDCVCISLQLCTIFFHLCKLCEIVLFLGLIIPYLVIVQVNICAILFFPVWHGRNMTFGVIEFLMRGVLSY